MTTNLSSRVSRLNPSWNAKVQNHDVSFMVIVEECCQCHVNASVIPRLFRRTARYLQNDSGILVNQYCYLYLYNNVLVRRRTASHLFKLISILTKGSLTPHGPAGATEIEGGRGGMQYTLSTGC